MKYLMKLDALAAKEGDQGMQWFNEIGILCSFTEQIMKEEIDSLSRLVTLHLHIEVILRILFSSIQASFVSLT